MTIAWSCSKMPLQVWPWSDSRAPTGWQLRWRVNDVDSSGVRERSTHHIQGPIVARIHFIRRAPFQRLQLWPYLHSDPS